ncbi:MAG TPA: AAA family ATPase, partial [Ktedonobacterales bacterium]
LPPAVASPVAEASGAPRVLEGRCPPYGEGITYWPLAEMLRELCGISVLDAHDHARELLARCVAAVLVRAGRLDDPELIAAYLGYTIGIESPERRQALLPADAQQSHDGLLRAWRVFIGALASTRPLVLVIDDIHWADDALLDLLDVVLNRSSGAPLLLVCQARPELYERRPTWGGEQDLLIALEPLSDHQSAHLMAALLPSERIPARLRQGILAKAGGNPFYLEEIIRMLADRGILTHVAATSPPDESHAAPSSSASRWRVATRWQGSVEASDPVIPDTVQGVVAARLDLLPPDERVVLQHAAVVGRYFWASVLQALAPEDTRELVESRLGRLVQKDLIQESDQGAELTSSGEQVYTFKHVLTREVTYAAIPRARRAYEHAVLAHWLEEQAEGRDDALIDLIAVHYQQYYLQAELVLPHDTARRGLVRERVIHYLLLAGDRAAARHLASRAERAYSDALEILAEDPLPASLPLQVHALSQRGSVRWLQSRADSAWSDYREALRLWLAVGLAPEGSAVPADWAQQGLRLYRLLVQLPARSGSWFVQPPNHEELWTYLRQGLELADTLGQRETLDGAGLLTAKSFFWWSWAERRGERELLDALHSAREAVTITEMLRAPREASEALDALGNMQATTADLRGHLESQTRRLYWARQIDDVDELVDIHAEVSSAYQVVGEYELAVAHAHEARDLARSLDAGLLRTQALQAEVLAYFEWDHWQEAIDAGEQLIATTAHTTVEHAHHYRRALLALACAYARLGRKQDARTVVARARNPRRAQEPLYVALYRARFALAHGGNKEAERLLLVARDYRAGRYALPFLVSELAQLGARTQD